MIDSRGSEEFSWPQIGQYEEGGHIVRVYKAAWAGDAKTDHIVKPPRKKS